MNEYSIYCTPEQTKKALELGAPIVLRSEYYEPQKHDFKLDTPIPCKQYTNGYCFASCPTAEEMIGWLEKQISFIDVIRQENDTWLYIVYPETHSNKNITVKGFSSRKKATLAAIDAALEYLVEK